MYRNIMVPLDGSPFAEHALPFAASIARRAGATLYLVRAHVPVAPLYSDRELVVDESLDGTIRESEAAYLDAVVKRLTEVVSVTVSRTLVDGPVADALHEHGSAVAADLVVMATHGRGGLSRFWLGSVADKLIRHLPMPILLVRPHGEAPDLSRDHVPQHILVPLDGSNLSEQAIGPAVELGTLMDADYLLVRVVDPLQTVGRDAAGLPISGFAPEGRQRLQDNAQAYLEQMARQLRERSVRVLTQVIVSCQAAEAILDQAAKSSTDLIALETHGRGGLTRMFLGSVADKVIRGAVTPLLVHGPITMKW
jgi:nucleotide-binding universal stress UspA family protein